MVSGCFALGRGPASVPPHGAVRPSHPGGLREGEAGGAEAASRARGVFPV